MKGIQKYFTIPNEKYGLGAGSYMQSRYYTLSKLAYLFNILRNSLISVSTALNRPRFGPGLRPEI